MQHALDLAARGTGCVSPNPLVGCVLVRDGDVIGEGWHQERGKGHAEVNALADARAKCVETAGATMYVTLEPCHHHGLTPPCTQAVIDAGITHVVFALADPNPKAAGGAQWLQQQGVQLTQGVLQKEARAQNRFFIKKIEGQRPYVIAKTATSLDGRIATRSGHSQWITGPEARERGHELRQAVDAIIVGADTVIADNPSLTVRLPALAYPPESIRHPRPVILDSTGRVPLHLTLLDGSLATRTIVMTSTQMSAEHRAKLDALGHEIITIRPSNGNKVANASAGIDPASVLEALSQLGINSVLLEGGAKVHGTFRDAGLIDEVWAFLAPRIIGGQSAPAAFSAVGSDTLDDATELEDVQLECLGHDVLFRAMVKSDNTHSPDAKDRLSGNLSGNDNT